MPTAKAGGAPSAAGTGVAPSAAGTGVAPSAAGTGVAPSAAGTGVAPSAAGTGVARSAAGTGVARSAAGTGGTASAAGTGGAPSAAGLVLAAGAGTRFGRPKITVPGWLDRAVAAMRGGGCRDVAVVTGAARVPLPDDVTEVHCAGWGRGIGASLRAGLEAVGGRGDVVAVHVVDSPDVSAAVVRRVLAAAEDRLARAVYQGRPGHPVVIPRGCLPALLADLADDDGAGPFLRSRGALEVECGDLATGQDNDYADSAASGRSADDTTAG